MVKMINKRRIVKNHTSWYKKVGYTLESLFGICWWTWKTNNYLKNCWSGPIKNKIILILTMLHFKKKVKKNNCRYHYQNFNDKIYSSWGMQQNILKLVLLGHFLPFYPPKKPQKSKFWKMEKFGEIIILYIYIKNHNYMMHGS